VHRIVAGHKNRRRDDDADRQILETRRYLADVDELLETEPTPQGFYTAMIQRHPNRLNRSSLWGSSQALYAGRVLPPVASGLVYPFGGGGLVQAEEVGEDRSG
jgi:hypothetical protein